MRIFCCKSTGRQKFREAKVPEGKCSGRQKYQEAKAPGGKSSGRQNSREAKVPGRQSFLFSGEAKVPGGKSLRRQMYQETKIPREAKVREAKVPWPLGSRSDSQLLAVRGRSFRECGLFTNLFWEVGLFERAVFSRVNSLTACKSTLFFFTKIHFKE